MSIDEKTLIAKISKGPTLGLAKGVPARVLWVAGGPLDAEKPN